MKAPTEHPVHELIATRWSPYSFSSRPVSEADLLSLLEAARWAPSSYNEQPWAFIIARHADGPEFERLLSCLVDYNQVWARHADVLALGVTRKKFVRNDKPNRHFQHDLGLAAAMLVIEATARGLCVHQMAGIDPERARKTYSVPDDWDILTGIAIGYAGEAPDLPQEVKDRDAARRPRKSLSEFVFSGKWDRPAGFLG